MSKKQSEAEDQNILKCCLLPAFPNLSTPTQTVYTGLKAKPSAACGQSCTPMDLQTAPVALMLKFGHRASSEGRVYSSTSRSLLMQVCNSLQDGRIQRNQKKKKVSQFICRKCLNMAIKKRKYSRRQVLGNPEHSKRSQSLRKNNWFPQFWQFYILALSHERLLMQL